MRLFALCIVLTLLPTHVVGQNSKPQTPDNAAHSKNAAPAQNPISQIIVQAQPQQKAPDQDSPASQGIFQRFISNPEWISAFGTLMIFIATVFYVIISACMLRKIRRQVELADVSATAAKRNADAVLNSQRALISVRVSQIGEIITFSAVNEGKTPAEIINDNFYRVSFLPSIDKLPAKPKYSDNQRVNPIWLSPGDHPHILCETKWEDLAHGMMAEIFSDVNIGINVVAIWGRVAYNDILTGDGHETRFCYWHLANTYEQDVGVWQIGGPQGYNKHT